MWYYYISGGIIVLFLVRHGSTNLNGSKEDHSVDRIRGWLDVPLNQDGIDEAYKAAEKLSNKNITKIYSSDLQRAYETAEIIGKKLNLPIHSEQDFRPWNLGEYQGKSTQDVLDDLSKLIENKDTIPKDGESFNTFLHRYISRLQEALKEAESQNIVIVAHYRNFKAAEAWKAAGQSGFNIDEAKMKTKGDAPGAVMEFSSDIKKSNEKMKNFKFHIPVELLKSDSENGEIDSWKIQGIASTPDEDLQGESVDQSGLDITPLKAGRGLFNVDHQKGPENIIGQIEDGEFVNQDGKKCLMVKGYLFKHQERAKAFYNILKSLKKGNGNRVHLSIEGKIIQRDMSNTKHIKKARIEKVALTLDPVNPYTYADLVKSLNADDMSVDAIDITEETIEINKSTLERIADEAQKALSAGAGQTKAPTEMVGGEVNTKESLESDLKKITYEKGKKKKKDMLSLLFRSLCANYPEEEPKKLASMIIETFKARTKKGVINE